MNHTVILDANLLVLLVVGSTHRDHITRHKRLGCYTGEEFDLLVTLLDAYSETVLIPHLLSEASNLIRYGVKEPLRSALSARLAQIIACTSEPKLASRDATNRPEYLRLGLTDAALLTLSQTGGCLLTADLDLYLAALGAGHASKNFFHMIG